MYGFPGVSGEGFSGFGFSGVTGSTAFSTLIVFTATAISTVPSPVLSMFEAFTSFPFTFIVSPASVLANVHPFFAFNPILYIYRLPSSNLVILVIPELY